MRIPACSAAFLLLSSASFARSSSLLSFWARNSDHDHHSDMCLEHGEIQPILDRWNSIFATGGASNVYIAVTEHVKVYDEQVTKPGPYASSRAELFAFLNAPSITVTYKPSKTVFFFHSCDRIAQRFEEDSIVTGNDPNATAKAGMLVSFKGIDLLTIDLKTRLVKNATSSSDLLNFYVPLGENPKVLGLP